MFGYICNHYYAHVCFMFFLLFFICVSRLFLEVYQVSIYSQIDRIIHITDIKLLLITSVYFFVFILFLGNLRWTFLVMSAYILCFSIFFLFIPKSWIIFHMFHWWPARNLHKWQLLEPEKRNKWFFPILFMYISSGYSSGEYPYAFS